MFDNVGPTDQHFRKAAINSRIFNHMTWIDEWGNFLFYLT